MNKTALKNFATNARKELIEKVKAKAFKIGITEESIKKAQFESSDAIYIDGKQLSATEKKQREKLISRINEIGYKQVVEEVAYTWFNRFTALRFMEVNNYLPTKVRVLSSSNPGSSEPDIIKDALSIDLDIDKEFVYELKLSNETEVLYKYLVIMQCNSLNKILPFMFETIDDYKAILFPEGLLAKDSFLREMTDTSIIPEQDWEQVEIIGWLYQFYISEKKDQVFADLKKNIKITKDNIPAATQLFTPHWIVRYMVENSLGRFWLDRYSDSSLKSGWKYYLEEADQEAEVIKNLEEIRQKEVNPEEITFLDPCCGSGHILVYAFDVLYEIYLEKGYANHDIPKLILEKNLFGLDIDDRATQIASFAVMMKAREKSRRVFNQDIKLNICSIQESNWITDDMMDILFNKSAITLEEGKNQREALIYLRDVFINAKEFGSILDVKSLNLDFLEKRLIEVESETSDIFQLINIEEIRGKLPRIIHQAQIMGMKYDVVCTNPPYMGSNGMNLTLSAYLKDKYPDTKADMSTVFMEKTINLCKPSGMMAMINIPVWMFLTTYEKIRKNIIFNNTFINMLHFGRGIFGSDFGTTAFVISKADLGDYRSTYRKLFKKQGSVDSVAQKETWFFEKHGHYTAKQKNFSKIPGSPIAYWVNESLMELFEDDNKLSLNFEVRNGITTGENERFIRDWYEVCFTKKEKWFPCNKGGSFRKWYGNKEFLIDWENDGYNLKTFTDENGRMKATLRSIEYNFKEAITMSRVTSSIASYRWLSDGFITEGASNNIYFNAHENKKDALNVLGLLNTKVSDYIMRIYNPTINIMPSDLRNFPIKFEENDVSEIVNENIHISKMDWDSFETSWDFAKHPLLLWKPENGSIKDAFARWEEFTENQFARLKKNEEELNHTFIELYGLQDEMTPDVDDNDITIRKADLERDIKSFISYAVGCMFGRYSLDEEGLIFSGEGFDNSKYCRYKPDNDNIIFVLPEAFFEDDIVSMFVEFVKETYGEENLSSNLEFISDSLGRKDGDTPKETIRKYFYNEFYKDHIQTYKRKPIYWLFSSGKQKAFTCLIYMHRYNKSTLSRIRTDYLHELQIRFDAEKKSLLDIINGDGPAKEISNAKKELKSLDLKIEELRAYDEKLHHMADMQIEIDLDDGVAVNYEKFDGLLAPIK